MNSKYPFIYIASLPRTGSTLLSEALTQLPYSFIFHEPHIGKNYFSLQANDTKRLHAYGYDMEAFVKYRLPLAFLLRRVRPFGYPQDYMVKQFKNKSLPRLYEQIKQIGVKEIKHMGWQNYVRHFPNMKTLITGRNPRDIYISMYKKYQRRTLQWRESFTPQTVAQFLNAQFNMQLGLHNATDSLLVRYEDFCTDLSVFADIKTFVNSPLSEVGDVGAFVATQPRRKNEYQIHGAQITTKRIERWKSETDSQLLADAHKLFDLMPQYCEFWEYE